MFIGHFVCHMVFFLVYVHRSLLCVYRSFFCVDTITSNVVVVYLVSFCEKISFICL